MLHSRDYQIRFSDKPHRRFNLLNFRETQAVLLRKACKAIVTEPRSEHSFRGQPRRKNIVLPTSFTKLCLFGWYFLRSVRHTAPIKSSERRSVELPHSDAA